jgi:fused signal recognition particle receptor
VIAKKISDAPHEVLLVLDGTQGQNTLSQAKKFAETIGVTGIFLSKLDGTARGGIVFAIEDETGIPVKLIGIGERPEDVEPFDPETFVDALIEVGM